MLRQLSIFVCAGNIRVFCRIRPIEIGGSFGCYRPVVALDSSNVLLRFADNKNKSYSFDKVFHHGSSQGTSTLCGCKFGRSSPIPTIDVLTYTTSSLSMTGNLTIEFQTKSFQKLNWSSNQHWMAITHAYLHMDRQAQGKPSPWWGLRTVSIPCIDLSIYAEFKWLSVILMVVLNVHVLV